MYSVSFAYTDRVLNIFSCVECFKCIYSGCGIFISYFLLYINLILSNKSSLYDCENPVCVSKATDNENSRRNIIASHQSTQC